jgi:lysophospholipase L1-like esterase
LAGTSSKIIAPFFGDVDTRGVGSQPVSYGWGNTTYEGHRAFCVNWVNVGYFAGHTDKLNSFQLLLVNREDSSSPGDFDIVFNYDKIQWESGDFSGGSGGLGGTSAAAGFSNGTGDEGTFYQLVGSLINGSFLDSSPTGLSTTSTDSTVQGRHVFKVRGGNAPLIRYVALGDSFQSGEGAYDYIEGTDGMINKCHRSNNAYPMRLVNDGTVDLDLDFGACSGALTTDLSVSAHLSKPPYDDGISQYDRLDSSTKLVTIGNGGNDLGFANILSSCIGSAVADWFNFTRAWSCEQELGSTLQASYDNMVSTNMLGETYKEIRRRAPFARVVVVGYPRLYVEGGKSWHMDNYCAGLRIVDQRWINSKVRDLNSLISNQAGSLGMQYVDIYDAPDGHELCVDGVEPFLNNLVPPRNPESFHPTAYGHGIIAGRVAGKLTSPDPGTYYNVLPGQTVTTTFQSSGEPVSLSTQWPGSDVVMSLTSPSGRVFDRATSSTDVQHEVGPTFESYHLSSAEAGTWTVRLYGAQVAPQGEPTWLSIWHVPAMNQNPTAQFTLSQDGRTVTVDAGPSTDADGSIVEYLWEFGDGATATGSRATHTYAEPGRYLTTLAIRDNLGGEDFDAADHAVDISTYDFVGFLQPVAAAPAISEVKAGRAIPMKFRLGGDYGLNILAPGSPASAQVECPADTPITAMEPTSTAGAGSLTYEAATDTYNYVWKTETSWSGTCRTFTMTLNDGSSHDATFRFVR